ncbi:MAG TPA: hypothetical protein VGX76_18985 [Pirellulales bacterium]|nr:hypothetical protein [Pirellulales bacterium]
MLIEQAIFTSLRSDRRDGYQLAAHSRGIAAADLRALALWGPSHDSLLETGPDAASVNFHPLPSGAFCVSKTTPAGGEYSGRGERIYTQCFVVPAEALERFGNNPFAILTAAFAQGVLRVHERVPAALEAFALAGKCTAVDQPLLSQLSAEPGAVWLGAIVEAALSSTSLALVAGRLRPRLIAGLLNCLPIECRPSFSFSTGLKHSPRRPFRLLGLVCEPAEQRRLTRQFGVTVLEPNGVPPRQLAAESGWSGFVRAAVAEGKTSFLAQQLAQRRPNLTLTDLPRLGDELLALMATQAHSAAEPPAIDRASQGPPVQVEVPRATSVPSPGVPSVRPALNAGDASRGEPVAAMAVDPLDDVRRADAPHSRFQRARQRLSASPDGDAGNDPAQVLGAACPAAIERLEQLDDMVFEAIAGKPGAIEQLRKLWPDVLAQVGPDLVEESREQYLRHALRVWRDCVQGDEIRNAVLATSAIGVVCLLFNE